MLLQAVFDDGNDSPVLYSLGSLLNRNIQQLIQKIENRGYCIPENHFIVYGFLVCLYIESKEPFLS